MQDTPSQIEVQVIDWHDGNPPEVAINFLAFNQLLTLSAENARTFAFRLIECADFIEPPFGEESRPPFKAIGEIHLQDDVDEDDE